MKTLYYMGLEPYQGRYTLQLQDWNEAVFKKRGIDYKLVPGKTIDNTKSISTGQVLDAHGRSFYSLHQMANLVQILKSEKVTSDDAIFFEDMFTPGIESLPYILNQIPAENRPKVWIRCLAQTIDPDDFVHVWNMQEWMSHYEHMVNSFATGILASNEEMVANAKVAGWKAPIYNISGLAFGKKEVQSRAKELPFYTRARRVVFAARWDQEKQPDFYMDLAEELHKEMDFVVLQGGPLKSNDPKYVARARDLQTKGILDVQENLSKDMYYMILANSRVMFNCALQDWTSNTVSEADAMGCNVLFPAYRSFPEIFANDHERMYIPWSKDDATNKLRNLIEHPHRKIGEISNWTNKTIDRYLDIMQGNGEQWRRDTVDYRNYTAQNKY